jgi:hypothetical protein
MGKKEKQRKEVRRTRIAQREHRGLYGQQARRGLSRREQEEMSEHLQEAISSPERLEENLELLEGLFESEEELRALRFEPRETLTLAIKHGILEKSVMEDEDLRTERMDRVLSNLVTPDFARQVSQTVQKVAPASTPRERRRGRRALSGPAALRGPRRRPETGRKSGVGHAPADVPDGGHGPGRRIGRGAAGRGGGGSRGG